MICQTLVADSFYVLSNSFFTTTNTFVAEVEAKLRSLSKSSSSSTVFLKDFFYYIFLWNVVKQNYKVTNEVKALWSKISTSFCFFLFMFSY